MALLSVSGESSQASSADAVEVDVLVYGVPICGHDE